MFQLGGALLRVVTTLNSNSPQTICTTRRQRKPLPGSVPAVTHNEIISTTRRWITPSPEHAPILSYKDIALGSIVRLPSKNNQNICLECIHPGCHQIDDEGMYNHPVVIVDMLKDEETNEIICHFAVITSSPKKCERSSSLQMAVSLRQGEISS